MPDLITSLPPPAVDEETTVAIGKALASLIPGIGEGMSAADAYTDFSEGDYGWGAFNTLGAIPLLGAPTKVVKGAGALGDLLRALKPAKKTVLDRRRLVEPIVNTDAVKLSISPEASALAKKGLKDG